MQPWPKKHRLNFELEAELVFSVTRKLKSGEIMGTSAKVPKGRRGVQCVAGLNFLQKDREGSLHKAIVVIDTPRCWRCYEISMEKNSIYEV